jgi:hypothetical protein
MQPSNQKLVYRDIAMVANRNEEKLSVDFAVVCDGPIDETSAFMPRTNSSVNMLARFSADRKTFYFSWHPPLPWQKSIWVVVFSKQEIHILSINHRWGFPCCYWSTLHVCRRYYPGRSVGTDSLVLSHQRRPSRLHGGLAPALIVSRPAQRSLHVTAYMLAKSPK